MRTNATGDIVAAGASQRQENATSIIGFHIMDRFTPLPTLSPLSLVRPTVRRSLLLLAAFVLSAWLAASAQAGSVTSLFSFTGPPKGLSPASGPVRGVDGNFYGTIPQGGVRNNGTIYRITPAGVLTTLYSFSGGADGGGPMAGLVLGKDGNFYGTTPGGGTGNYGTVFRFTPAGVLTTLFSFSNDVNGGQPEAALVQGSDGNFYGTTQVGGGAVGTIFRITPEGALTTIYTLQFGFEVGTDGYGISDALVQGRDGNFYGVASSGGVSGNGTVFRVTPDGALTTLYSFTGNEDGGNPVGALAQAADGSLYGTTTSYGGEYGQGTVFRVTTDGTLATIHTFGYFGDGGDPTTGLVLGSDGNFYGATNQGGDNNLIGGTVFQLTPAGVLTTLYSFSGGADGNFPGLTLAQDTDGSLYGVTLQGGAGGYGTVFRVTIAGVHTTLFTFQRGTDALQPTTALTKGADGNFYGTTQQGGLYNNGTVFQVTPTGVLTTIYNFTNGTDGTAPAAALTLGNDGNLYGTANGGPGGYGSVFQVTPAGQLTTLYNFTGGEDGGIPAPTALVKSSDGSFYGATVSYDPSGFSPYPGTIYQITPAGTLTTLHAFTDPTDGPVVGLIQGRDGNLYGTSNGGTNSSGRVFRFTPAGVLTSLYSFDGGVAGGNPAGSLVQGRDGKFYGVTQQGGVSGGGTVYAIDTVGALTTLASFDNAAGGGFPYAGLALGTDGNFYGTTLMGGTNGWGTVFRVTRAGVLKSLYSFTNGTDGGQPLAGLTQGADGNFYGTTYAGGANGLGAVFRLRVIQSASNPIAIGVAAPTAVKDREAGKADATASH